jgi:hypothetical protein
MGNKKELVAYKGIEETTYLMSTVRLAWDRVFARHPSILLNTCSKISLKAADFDLRKKRGRPRYFEEIKALL